MSDVLANIAKNNDVNAPAGAAPAQNPVAAATGATAMPALTGNPMTDLYNAIEAQGNELIADLQAALNLANYQIPGGGTADPIAATAIAALIPLVQLVIDGPPSVTPAAGAAPAPAGTPGILTEAEKIRIITITVQSTAFKQAVSPFVVDTIQQVQGLINGMMTLFTGGAIAGLVAVPKIP